MGITAKTLDEFIDILSSKEPVPGGGGASALVGAIGTALGNMMGSLTLGKKKYSDVQEDILKLKVDADELQKQLLSLVEKDAEVFEPLSRAYSLPKDTEEQRIEKARIMEEALNTACTVPLEIMEKCCSAIGLLQEFSIKGAIIALSDAGVGIVFLKAALMGASLNVFINTKSMSDRALAESINARAEGMLTQYTALADEVYNAVAARLK